MLIFINITSIIHTSLTIQNTFNFKLIKWPCNCLVENKVFLIDVILSRMLENADLLRFFVLQIITQKVGKQSIVLIQPSLINLIESSQENHDVIEQVVCRRHDASIVLRITPRYYSP